MILQSAGLTTVGALLVGANDSNQVHQIRYKWSMSSKFSRFSFHLLNPIMSRWFPADKFRRPCAPLTLTSVRSRSTSATSPSFLEARDRVQEHARKISSSSTDNAIVSRAMYYLYLSLPSAYLIAIVSPAHSAPTYPRSSNHPQKQVFRCLHRPLPLLWTLLSTIRS